jgi:hypothetical protein
MPNNNLNPPENLWSILAFGKGPASWFGESVIRKVENEGP